MGFCLEICIFFVVLYGCCIILILCCLSSSVGVWRVETLYVISIDVTLGLGPSSSSLNIKNITYCVWLSCLYSPEDDLTM